MSDKARKGIAALVAVAVASALFGGCVANSMHESATQEAFEQLFGGGNVPGTGEETATGYNGVGFQPSDSPPRCLPFGTVTYEIYDSAADMRYWVFRWPLGCGYSVVPRLMLDDSGQLVPYTPPRYEPTGAQDD